MLGSVLPVQHWRRSVDGLQFGDPELGGGTEVVFGCGEDGGVRNWIALLGDLERERLGLNPRESPPRDRTP